MTGPDHDDAVVDDPDHALRAVDGTVAGLLGLGYPEDDPEAPMRMELAPTVLDDHGDVSLGALGVLVDLASTRALRPRPHGRAPHAEISVHRLQVPQGRYVHAITRDVRAGTRTGVLEIDVVDDNGRLVAYSSQEIAFIGVIPGGPPPAPRRMWWPARPVALDRPLYDLLGLRRDGEGTWQMELAPTHMNTAGALHGGASIALVDVAARSAVEDTGATSGPCRTAGAQVRYLVPGRVGPFLARTRVLGAVGNGFGVRVEVVDPGRDGRAVMLATATVVPAA